MLILRKAPWIQFLAFLRPSHRWLKLDFASLLARMKILTDTDCTSIPTYKKHCLFSERYVFFFARCPLAEPAELLETQKLDCFFCIFPNYCLNYYWTSFGRFFGHFDSASLEIEVPSILFYVLTIQNLPIRSLSRKKIDSENFH